ncbi:MAG: hypothetical protein AB1761_02820, partial [Pseudomonadota bacterium]
MQTAATAGFDRRASLRGSGGGPSASRAAAARDAIRRSGGEPATTYRRTVLRAMPSVLAIRFA